MRRLTSPSRRDFLRLAGLGLSTLAFKGLSVETLPHLAQLPAGEYLGRVAVYPNAFSTDLKTQPNETAPTIRAVGQDEVVVWLRDAIGSSVSGRTNVRWAQVQTLDDREGYIYAADLQPVRNSPNTPITSIPGGKSGFWAEVTVPYVQLQLNNNPIGPGIRDLILANQQVHLYYGQVVWLDEIRAAPDGSIVYRFNEAPQHGYGPGDLFYADAAAFRPLSDEDVAPIHPEVDPQSKKIVIDSTPGRQFLSCMEGNAEVYACRVSTGFVGQVTDFSTPVGDQAVSWKIFSIHMGANLPGSGAGHDTLAVPWPVFFNQPSGAAIHGTYWHNDFGVRRSHGCVNVSPEDAKWIFRWTTPFLSLDQSEWREVESSKTGGSFSTSVTVSEMKT